VREADNATSRMTLIERRRRPDAPAARRPGLRFVDAASAGHAEPPEGGPAEIAYHDGSRSGVAVILWIVRSAPLYSSSAESRKPTVAFSVP